MTKFKEGDEVLVRATVKDVYANGYFNLQVQANGVEGSDENPLIKLLVQNSENCLIAQIQHPDLIPASALEVNKELLEALKPFAERASVLEMFDASPDEDYDDEGQGGKAIKMSDLRRAREAIAAAEKGA